MNLHGNLNKSIYSLFCVFCGAFFWGFQLYAATSTWPICHKGCNAQYGWDLSRLPRGHSMHGWQLMFIWHRLWTWCAIWKNVDMNVVWGQRWKDKCMSMYTYIHIHTYLWIDIHLEYTYGIETASMQVPAKWNSVEISKPAAPLFGASLRSGLFRPGPRRIPTGSGFVSCWPCIPNCWHHSWTTVYESMYILYALDYYTWIIYIYMFMYMINGSIYDYICMSVQI